MAEIEVSVVIPVYNGAHIVHEQLEALSQQDFVGNWEVLVIDNGSTDHLEEAIRGWDSRLPGFRYVLAAERKGPGYARNVGSREARGRAIAYCDSDDRVCPDWLTHLARALERAEVVGGALSDAEFNPAGLRVHDRWPRDDLPKAFGSIRFASSANMGIRPAALWNVGGWCERPGFRAEDPHLAWKLATAGYEILFEPAARVYYRHRQGVLSWFKKGYQLGKSEYWLLAQIPTDPPDHPRGKRSRTLLWLAGRTWLVPFSPTIRAHWARKVGYLMGWITQSRSG